MCRASASNSSFFILRLHGRPGGALALSLSLALSCSLLLSLARAGARARPRKRMQCLCESLPRVHALTESERLTQVQALMPEKERKPWPRKRVLLSVFLNLCCPCKA